MVRLIAAAVGVLFVLMIPGDGKAKGAAQPQGRRESWDYAPEMAKVARRFTGVAGVVLHLGDSITYASPYTAWARQGKGKAAEDEAVLSWSHCGDGNDRDGWWLAHVETGRGGSYTAAGGVRADQYLAGGFKGLPPLDEIIRAYNPQVAIVMLGTNDAWQNRSVFDYRRDMDAIVERLLDNGTIPILSTIPPLIDNQERAEEYNQALWRIAELRRLPVIDYYGEILARRPGMTWDGTLMEKGDGHPSASRNGVTPESAPTPESLRESGYLLRGWLSVRKLEEVKRNLLDGLATAAASSTTTGEKTVRERIENTPYPRIGMCWAPLRRDRSLASMARHDLIMTSVGAFGLEWDRQPEVLATGFTPESIKAARERTAEVRKLNPNAVLIGDLSFYEFGEDQLPEDHPWWLRVDGKREQFWPGTYRVDWNREDYQESVVKRTIALYESGVVDGVFYDNWRDEPEPWIKIIRSIRERVGDKFLIFINVGYDIGNSDWIAPYLNGIMYESGWSHPARSRWRPTETWDDRIRMMQRAEELLLPRRISLIERFEEVRDHAGWPTDAQKGKEIKRDPAARHWTMCYALIVGDFYYLFSDSTSHRHDWYPEYDVKIGLPVAPGERINAHVWRRRYDRALVVMNLPDATEPYEVSVDKPAKDSFTGEAGTTFTLPPGDGRILVFE